MQESKKYVRIVRYHTDADYAKPDDINHWRCLDLLLNGENGLLSE